MEEENTLRDDIIDAIAETKEPQKEVVETPQEEVADVTPQEGRDEKGRFKSKEAAEAVEEAAPVIKPVEVDAPTSLTGAIKAKWKDLPEDVRSEWSKREADIHKMMTSHDGDLRLGREMKDVVMPYMPLIQAEGGTPASAVKDLLNTAYVLRTGTPQQKSHLLQQVARQYGVDLGQEEQTSVDPTIQQLQQEIAQLRQSANPQAIRQQLQAQVEEERIVSEVKAFAADSSKKHYEQVKAEMAALLGNGAATNMQDAYDRACWANPAIRSTLLAEQTSAEQAKRKTEIESKKKAASSITGSPGITVPNTGVPDRSLREEIRANLRAATS